MAGKDEASKQKSEDQRWWTWVRLLNKKVRTQDTYGKMVKITILFNEFGRV